MAPGQSRRARRPRGEDPRDARAADAGARQVARRGRSPARELDAAAARVVAGDLLSRRAWTVRGLEMRLRRRRVAPEMAAAVVADLAARGYVDDVAFARQWVAARAERGYGAARLRAELSALGVAPDVVGQALASLADDVQLERARAAAARRLASLGGAVPARAAARLRDHLLRRGFAGSTVSRVIREILGGRASEPER